MGKKSTRENKNLYQISRENASLTREAAAEQLGFISSDRIDRIEREKTTPDPGEVLAMADAYKNPALCNYYCSHKCLIGQKYVPEIKMKDLSVITLEMLSNLNNLMKEKDRIIEIAVDGKISPDEIPDFQKIQSQLEDLSIAIDTLKLWVDHSIASGKMEQFPPKTT